MKNLACVCLGVLFLAAVFSTASFAHHSFAAEFDADKPVTLSGVVTRVDWRNPHAFLYMDVTDEETGEVTNWAIELGSPNGLRRLGWHRTKVAPGDRLTVEGSLARVRPNLANARTAMLVETGERLGASSSQAANPRRE